MCYDGIPSCKCMHAHVHVSIHLGQLTQKEKQFTHNAYTLRWLHYSPEGCSLCKFMDGQKGRNSHIHHHPARVEYRPPAPKGWCKDVCPFIMDYNTYMGGVDRGDQVRGYNSCRTNCRKFYKYIFHFLLDVAITNAFILQKRFYEDAPFSSIKEFQLKLASELIGDYCSRKRAGRSGGVLRSLPLRHFPTIPESDPMKKAKHKRARCTRCYSRSKWSVLTSWYCLQCQVWLCHTGEQNTDCFMMWHTQHIPEQS